MCAYPKPNYTMIPNILLDKQMAEMGEAELRVVLAIARKTLGWHKEIDTISFSQLALLTGMTKTGAYRGIQQALEHGYIGCIQHGRGRGSGDEYYLAVGPEDKLYEGELIEGNEEDKLYEGEQLQAKKLYEGEQQKKVVKEKLHVSNAPTPIPRPRNLLFDKIALRSFGVSDTAKLPKSSAGWISGIVADIKKLDEGVTPEKLDEFYSWDKAEYPDCTTVKERGKFSLHYAAFLANPEKHRKPASQRQPVDQDNPRAPRHYE